MAGGLWAVLAGYIFTFYNGQVQEQRKARIERVNLQLRDLYGPLLACVTATKSAYEAMVRQHSPDGTRPGLQAAITAAPDGPEARAYRQWMTSVLQPINERAAAIVQGGFSLMEGSALESEMLQLVAHVSASRVILERWAQGELGTPSAISYPDKLEQGVRREFSRLKAQQADLLGVTPLVVKAKAKAHGQDSHLDPDLHAHRGATTWSGRGAGVRGTGNGEAQGGAGGAGGAVGSGVATLKPNPTAGSCGMGSSTEQGRRAETVGNGRQAVESVEDEAVCLAALAAELRQAAHARAGLQTIRSRL